MINYNFLRDLREKKGFSQEMVSQEIGVSRQTYIEIEKGHSELSISQAKKLADLFDISIDNIISVKTEKEPEIVFEINKCIKKSRKRELNDPTPEERISIPQERVEKFKQVLLYILAKIGGKPNIGQTVLYKLLYFIDFDYYEKFEEQLIGAKYMKNTHGPTPVAFAKIISELEKEKKIETIKSQFYKYDQTKYLVNPKETTDLSSLSGAEIAHIDWEISRLSDLTANQISALSHKDTPWLIAKEKEIMDYEYVFYRPEETSVRDYEPV
jgi:transcriptional regulator with XRE-family HTH domain